MRAAGSTPAIKWGIMPGQVASAPGHSYDIRIRRWSGTNDTWYGIAWTVSGIQLWPPLELNGLSA
jgi:hypothetical protein